MTGWNLPPGVTAGMIPGNRPEDEEFRNECEEVEIDHPNWDEERIQDEAERRMEKHDGREIADKMED